VGADIGADSGFDDAPTTRARHEPAARISFPGGKGNSVRRTGCPAACVARLPPSHVAAPRRTLSADSMRIELDDVTRPAVLALLEEHLRNMHEITPLRRWRKRAGRRWFATTRSRSRA